MRRPGSTACGLQARPASQHTERWRSARTRARRRRTPLVSGPTACPRMRRHGRAVKYSLKGDTSARMIVQVIPCGEVLVRHWQRQLTSRPYLQQSPPTSMRNRRPSLACSSAPWSFHRSACMPVFATALFTWRSSTGASAATVIQPLRMSKLKCVAPPTTGPTTSLRTATSSAQSIPRTLNTRRSAVRLRSFGVPMPVCVIGTPVAAPGTMPLWPSSTTPAKRAG